jgi:hypothetical protein
LPRWCPQILTAVSSFIFCFNHHNQFGMRYLHGS